jgi:hypothetical protein
VTQTVPAAPTTTAPLSPEDRDARFVARVHQNLPPVFYDRPVEGAQNLCREIATGDATKHSDVAYLVTLHGVTVEQATFWFDTAVETYCPQYK